MEPSEWTKDAYGGVTLTSTSLRAWIKVQVQQEQAADGDSREAALASTFREQLATCLAGFRADGTRGVWLTVPDTLEDLMAVPGAVEPESVRLANARSGALIAAAMALGMELHHARGRQAQLTLWLPENQPNMLPVSATHVMGVGGFVVRETEPGKHQVLAIKEGTGPYTAFWKLPGGRVDAGEELYDAVLREVEEETGVVCRVESLLGFRQSQGPWGTVDMYFVFRLAPIGVRRPEGGNDLLPLEQARPQASEIGELTWMDVGDFLDLPHYKKGVFGRLHQALHQNIKGKYKGIALERLQSVFRKGENTLYHACLDFDDPTAHL